MIDCKGCYLDMGEFTEKGVDGTGKMHVVPKRQEKHKPPIRRLLIHETYMDND